MKTTTISRAAIKKALIEILKKEPDILGEFQRNYPINVATKDDIKSLREDLKFIIETMNARFEAVDKRFESMQREMDKRFEAMDKRFESLIREMNARFEAVNKRLNLITWVIGIGFTLIGGALITLIGLIIHLITKV